MLVLPFALGCSGASAGASPGAGSVEVAIPGAASTGAASPGAASTGAASHGAASTRVASPSAASAGAGSSWVQSAVAKIRVDKGDAGGMRGCKGSLTPEAKAFFTSVYAEASKCGAPSLAGSVTFHSTLEEGGGLSEFSVLDDKLGAPDVVKCIQERMFSIDFPKVDPKTPCVQLVHPMAFP
jgi:hypothetical protein